MGSERSFWRTLQKNGKPYWEAERVENPVGPGTPDVYYTINSNGKMGWMELKYVVSFPKRLTTPLKIDHFTPQQRAFIRRHGSIGAQVHLFIQVGREYFLLEWQDALKVGELLYNDYKDLAFYWKDSIDFNELFFILS
jgi:hypothetical protein